MALYQKTQAPRKPQITATLPLYDGSPCYGTFTFADGSVVQQQGGLVCSQHGRRHCTHHHVAHAAILAAAAHAAAPSPAALLAADSAAYDAFTAAVDRADDELATWDAWGDYQTARMDAAVYVPVGARYQADAYGDSADYVPGDYASHEYR